MATQFKLPTGRQIRAAIESASASVRNVGGGERSSAIEMACDDFLGKMEADDQQCNWLVTHVYEYAADNGLMDLEL